MCANFPSMSLFVMMTDDIHQQMYGRYLYVCGGVGYSGSIYLISVCMMCAVVSQKVHRVVFLLS